MRVRSLLLTLAVVILPGKLAPESFAAPDAGERCRMIKLSAAGAHAREVLRCHVRAIGFAMATVPSCLAAADAKFARTFARAEAKTSCPPSLAAAQATSAQFVADLLASAAPTPVPTHSPTPGPSPMFTGCGNGLVETGEQCDGQAYCGPSCSFGLPTVCCGPVGFCVDGPFPVTADQCFLAGLPYVLGAVCEPSTPDCQERAACEGSCAPEVTFPATSVCCELTAGCADDTIDDTIELWQFVFQGCIQAGGTVSGLGSCGAGGSCIPGG